MNLNKFLFSWILFFAIWLAFTTTFEIQEVVAGALITLVIAIFTFSIFTSKGLAFFQPKRLVKIIIYFFVFLRELIKANLNVARLVLHPRLPIKPGIVKFQTNLHSDMAKMILANSITLTPGTLSVDIVDNIFYIHWIEVSSADPEIAHKEIAGQFEKLLKEIFE